MSLWLGRPGVLAFSGPIPDDAHMATTQCRYCGYQIDAAAPNCGNCGQSVSGSNPLARPSVSSGPLGSPGGPLAAGRGPLGALVRPLVILLALGGLGFFLWAPAREAIEGVIERVETGELFGETEDQSSGAGSGVGTDVDEPAGGYDGIQQIAADLRAGGLPCRDVTVDAGSDLVETGSCRVRGTHVQILVYRTQGTLNFALSEIYDDDWPFTYVHDDNWFVTTQTPVARKVQRILGGTLRIAPGS